MENNQRWFIGVLVVVVIVSVGYYLYINQKTLSIDNINPASNNSISEPTKDASLPQKSQSDPIVNKNEPVTPEHSQMIITPASGVSPLKIIFSNFPTCANEEELDFGDKTSSVSNGYTGYWPTEGISHTYTVSGTYTAKLWCSLPSRVISAVTVTVK